MKYRVVMDSYGYVVAIWTEEAYKEDFSHLYDLFQPDYKEFDTIEEAKEFQVKQNEYTKNRIQEGL